MKHSSIQRLKHFSGDNESLRLASVKFKRRHPHRCYGGKEYAPVLSGHEPLGKRFGRKLAHKRLRRLRVHELRQIIKDL